MGTVTSLISLTGIITMFGMSSAIGRFYYIYKEKNKEKEYLGSIWTVQTCFALVFSLLIFMMAKPIWSFLAPDIPQKPFILFVLICGILSFSSGIYPIWLRVQEKPLKFITLQLCNSAVLVFSVLIFLVVLKRGIIGTLTAILISSIFMSIVSLIFLGRTIKFRYNEEFLRSTFSYATWIFVGAIGSILLNRSQLFVLQHYGDMSAVGILNLGLSLSGFITMVSISFTKAWQPFVFSAQNINDACDAISKTTKYYVAFMLLSTLLLSLFSKEIISLIANSSYSNASGITKLLSIAMFFNALGLLPAAVLLYEKRADISQWITMGSAIMNIFLILIFVQIWQISGIAWAMVLSSAISLSINFIIAQKIAKVNFIWNHIFWLFFIGFTIIFCDYILNDQLCIHFPFLLKSILFLLYPVGLVITGVIKREELLSGFIMIKNMFAKFV